MNQYIITEDDLVVWEDDLDAIDGEWGVGRGRGTDEHTNKQVSIINRVRSHPYQSERGGEYYAITKEELSFIKNNCARPETDSCDGCKFVCDDEKSCPCSWIGANGLEEEILSRQPYQSERDTCPQNKIWQHCPAAEQIRKQEREKVLDELDIKLDYLLSCPISRGIRLGLEEAKIVVLELRQAGEP